MAPRAGRCRPRDQAARSGRGTAHTPQSKRSLCPKKKTTPPSLRHSSATHLIEVGVDLLEVQKIPGHYSILTTERYTHLTSHTNDQARVRINALMDRFAIAWGVVK